MGFMDRAKETLDQHDDKVDQALDKGGDTAKSRFAGHDSLIDGGVDRAQQATGDGDTTAAGQQVPGGQQAGPDDQTGGYEGAQEVPGGPETDVPAGPGHVPPQQ